MCAQSFFAFVRGNLIQKFSRAASVVAIGFLVFAHSAFSQVQQAGTLYVDLRATDASAGSAVWANQGTLGNFTRIGGPTLVTNVASTGFRGVLFGGVTNDAYLGPNSVADIDGAGDRSIEVWAYNPALVQEETTVSWGHRGTQRRDMAFNFGNNATWGAATHWADDVSWGAITPSANAWHHLVYTYSNTVVRVYMDGALANSRTLGGALDTFPGEPINLGCQIEADGRRSLPYGGYLNTVRIHGGVLSSAQIQNNFQLGPAPGITTSPDTPTGLTATPGYNEAWLQWNPSAGATRYSIKRATASSGPYASIVTNLTTTSYLDTNLLTGTNYFYVVSAANFLGESTNSNPVSLTPGIPSQPVVAGTLYVDLRATNSSAGSASWINQGTLGSAFASIGAPGLSNDVASTKIPGVFFNGSTDAYEGPNSVADIEGGSDRSIEVWAYNPTLVPEETTVSWGHRGTTRRDMAFNFGNNAVWGAATHWADDVSWANSVPSAGAWHHLVYTYANNVVQVYVDGRLANMQGLGGPLDTFPGEPINLGCQRDTALGTRSLLYSGYLNTVRIHGGVLNPAQVQANYYNGPSAPPPVAVNDSITLNPGAMALIPVLANDNVPSLFPASAVIVSGPSHGTALAKSDGRVLYTHDGGLSTSDQFSYVVQNSLGATSGVATVFVSISSALRLPNTTLTVPDTPPALNYQLVDAFPGLVITQALAMRTPIGAVYSNLLFFVERRGFISYIDMSNPNPTRQIFLDVSSQVSFDNTAEGEMGLLSMDFNPGFATNGFFYVTYIATGGNPYRERLARFTANPTTLAAVNTNTQQILWDTTKRQFNHNGGDLHFGNDGYLYISMGDEGDQYNASLNAQRLDRSLYAGILRIDVDKKPGSLEPKPPTVGEVVNLTIPTDGLGHAFYSIPPDNPFLSVTNLYGRVVDTNHLRGEFYAIGFRHPWRFSIDPFTSEIWVGHVGQDLWESVDVLQFGGNYGWPYYEASTYLTVNSYGGAPTHPGLTNPPSGFVMSQALWVYPHSSVPGADPNFDGLDVIGGVVYHGSGIPQLTNAYVFGDFDIGGNVWALRRTNSTVTVERIVGEFGIGAYGTDPRNGDVLMANYINNKIRRLVFTDATTSAFPQKLSDTGVFADTTTLTPNPGIVNYEPIVAFWSDYAIKRRWFCIPDLTNQVSYATDANWIFPVGMKWIKHFDLELERGNPATKKRIETRIIVKTTNGVYGVSYKWNDDNTEAYLAPESGTNFNLNVLVGSTTITQQWEIPSRASCLACHTPVAGFALSFNTRELNQTTNMNNYTGNQLSLLSQSGYLDTAITAPQTLPAFARADDATSSLEHRVRSYLSENCVQCHQPGGAGAPTWDARPWLTLDQTHLINGALQNNGGNPANKVIVPGDTNHSVLLQRIIGNGFGRMPPLATHQLDQGAINLLTAWISTDLTNYQSFANWQLAHFLSTNAPNALASADPDGDGANNYIEYLTKTDPQIASDVWKLGINVSGGFVNVTYPQIPNLGIVIDTGTNFLNWSPWNVPGNQLIFGSSGGTALLQGPVSSAQYFRARLITP
jgi:mono/diheme cytochrome c family protein